MTGRSNSHTHSRKMWMLSASSERRWSWLAVSVDGTRLGFGTDLSAAIDITPLGPQNKKARVAPGFRSALRQDRFQRTFICTAGPTARGTRRSSYNNMRTAGQLLTCRTNYVQLGGCKSIYVGHLPHTPAQPEFRVHVDFAGRRSRNRTLGPSPTAAPPELEGYNPVRRDVRGPAPRKTGTAAR